MEEIREAAAETLNGILISNLEVIRSKGDYMGDDGFLYCGSCHVRKERIVTFPEGMLGADKITRRVRCTCKCEQKAMEDRKKQDEYQEKMRRIQRIRDISMMESKYHGARFASYHVTDQNRKVYQIARKYADHFEKMLSENQGIIFWGTVGTGKSYTAACIANALLDRNITVVMTSFVKILQNLQQQTQFEVDYISALNNASLLILDDLGTERNTEYALEKVYNIIDSRVRVCKPMILTTNMTLSEMQNTDDVRYKRIYDRIFETCLPVEVSGKSFRKAMADQRFDRMAQFLNE